MKIGAHISIAGGIEQSPKRARQQGCEVFQIFVQSPQTYQTPEIGAEQIKKFKTACQKYHLAEFYVHAPYLINLASKNNKIRYGSISLLSRNFKRANILGAKYFMTHLGSAKDFSRRQALLKATAALEKILAGGQNSCQFLLEMSAGAGQLIGDKFSDFAFILKSLKSKNVGVCLDTAHIFASGYDLRGHSSVVKTLQEFDKTIGLSYLKLMHCNDSAADLGSHRDRHAHLGQGKIGLAGFTALISQPNLKNINFILETDDNLTRRIIDIKILKNLRNNLKV